MFSGLAFRCLIDELCASLPLPDLPLLDQAEFLSPLTGLGVPDHRDDALGTRS